MGQWLDLPRPASRSTLLDNVKHIPRKHFDGDCVPQFDGDCVLRSPVDVVGGVDEEGVHSFRLRGDVEDIVVHALLRVTQRMVRLRCVLALPEQVDVLSGIGIFLRFYIHCGASSPSRSHLPCSESNPKRSPGSTRLQVSERVFTGRFQTPGGSKHREAPNISTSECKACDAAAA